MQASNSCLLLGSTAVSSTAWHVVMGDSNQFACAVRPKAAHPQLTLRFIAGYSGFFFCV